MLKLVHSLHISQHITDLESKESNVSEKCKGVCGPLTVLIAGTLFESVPIDSCQLVSGCVNGLHISRLEANSQKNFGRNLAERENLRHRTPVG